MSGLGGSDSDDNNEFQPADFANLPESPFDDIPELKDAGSERSMEASSMDGSYHIGDVGLGGQPGSPQSSLPDENQSCESYSRHNYKIIVIGDANSGKTTFINRYIKGEFDEEVATTIGVDYSLKTVTNRQRQMIIMLQIWDIAGQDRNRTMVRPFFNDAVGAVVMADCTKMGAGYESAWKSDLDAKVALPDGSALPAVLVMNKCDLLEENEYDSLSEEAESIMDQQGYIGCMLASAKENVNVDAPFQMLIQHLVTLHDRIESYQKPKAQQITLSEFVALKQRGYVPEREPQQCGC